MRFQKYITQNIKLMMLRKVNVCIVASTHIKLWNRDGYDVQQVLL